MPEHYPEHDPGHLDIDAVSAFVDRDFEPADLASIEAHLVNCPPCRREVLEIRTTVVLLSALPQYAPRRSFRLSQEHARASRRRDHARVAPPLAPHVPASRVPLAPAPQPVSAAFGGWMPALHVAALVTGVLLLLVTVGDLTGIIGGDQAAMRLAAPTALAETPAPRMAARPAPEATDAELAEDPAAPAAAISAYQGTDEGASGTDRTTSASEGVPEGAEQAPRSPRLVATSVAVAAVTRAMPTPGAARALSGEAAPASPAPEPAANAAQPSRLRLAQLALALLLAWLVVSIVGLRWVRRA